MLLETPNLRLFEIGINHLAGSANFGWADTSEGCWGAIGDAEGHQDGSQSLWVTLWGHQSASCRTKTGWLIVSIDGIETPICLANRVDYLHIHGGGGGNRVDLSGLEAGSFPADVIIEVQRVASIEELFGTAYGDRVIRTNDDLHQGEADDMLFLTSLSQIELDNDVTMTGCLETDAGDGAIVIPLPQSLFCDVAIIDSANLGLPGGCRQLRPDDVSQDCFVSTLQAESDLDEDGRLESWNRATLRKRSTARQRIL